MSSAAVVACGAIVRSLGSEHYGDTVISTALEGFDGVFLLPLTDEKIPASLLRRMKAATARIVVLDQNETGIGLRSVIVVPLVGWSWCR